MKYLPLIWAALRRKPTRTILTIVSVTIAFAVFGLTIGMNASFGRLAGIARADRIYVHARFGGALTLAQRGQIARIAGVGAIGASDAITGYRQDPANIVAVLMLDAGMRQAFPELPIAPAQWAQRDAMRDGIFVSRAMAARQHVTAGDAFALVTPGGVWNFRVLAVVAEAPLFPTGFIVGNYAFLDQARPPRDRGKVGQFWVLAKDGGEDTARAIDRLLANSPAPSRSETEKSVYEDIGGAGSDLALAADGIAAIGMAMILFLTANAIAQSVRERIPEFAVMKTLGFSDRGVVALVFAEAALPCLAGAACGLGLAKALGGVLPALLAQAAGFPAPSLSPPVLGLAFALALLIAFVSAALPALRIARLDVAAALARR